MAARTPPKNILPIFNPVEFLPKESVVVVSSNVEEEVNTLLDETAIITNYMSKLGLTAPITIQAVTGTSMLGISDPTRYIDVPVSAISRSAGYYLWKASFTFNTTTTQNATINYAEICLVVNGGEQQMSCWNAPYSYNGVGQVIQQFRTVQVNTTFLLNLLPAVTSSYYIRCRALLSNTSQTFVVGGPAGIAGTELSYSGNNIQEFRFGSGINV